MPHAPVSYASSVDSATYIVLLNDEQQFSLWPAIQPVPQGWRPSGFCGPRSACVAYVDAHWVDMRPLSLRAQARSSGGR